MRCCDGDAQPHHHNTTTTIAVKLLFQFSVDMVSDITCFARAAFILHCFVFRLASYPMLADMNLSVYMYIGEKVIVESWTDDLLLLLLLLFVRCIKQQQTSINTNQTNPTCIGLSFFEGGKYRFSCECCTHRDKVHLAGFGRVHALVLMVLWGCFFNVFVLVFCRDGVYESVYIEH